MSEISDSFRAGRFAQAPGFPGAAARPAQGLPLGDQRLGRAAGVLAALFRRAGQRAFDRRFRPVRHRLGGGRHAVAHPGIRLRVAALPDRDGAAAPDRRLHGRLPAAVAAVAAVPGGRIMGGLRAVLRRRHAGRRLCHRHRRRSAARAPERAGDDRQQRHGRFGRAATLAIISSAIRAAAAVVFIAMPAGGLAGWTLALSRRQRGLARRRDPVLLSAPGAGAEGRHLFQAAARRALCRRRRSAVLPADGAGQAAGAGDRRRRSSPASTPSSCGWST